ncbi:site-specific DNA-methyltransferase [Allisonella histaminiformans]|uniref:site-specific DNA-methyltransferase n=1 Tax=Allisonella histaminiformans TaxID=209880 RepID=UPI0022E78EDF|nr:site-specific DNA-methyltransferase [Allisonella histaminiformans]
MDKMRMESEDIQQDNVAKIAALFPNCVTEARDEDGHLKKAINFEMLKQMLSDSVIDGDEAYEFTWVGKKASIVEANRHIRKTLRPNKEESSDWDHTHNIFIEGENLDALKLLQESYLGKVKMIYIDPPYNTGSDRFIYPDQYGMNQDEYDEAVDLYDEDGNKTFRENSDSDPRYHSKWCSMIYQRLLLARNFLTDDGAIFISIDDKEQENLKKIGDEVFGSSNFVATIVWQHSIQPKGYLGSFSIQHSYIMIWCKASDQFKLGSLERTAEDNKAYSNPDNDPNGPWRSGDVRNALYRPNLIYDIISPSGKVIKPCANGWRWSKETVKEKIRTGEIVFSEDETRIIRKIYLKNLEGRAPETIWFGKDVGTTREGISELKDLFDRAPFDTPKPTKLIERCAYLMNDPNMIVMDFFAGSGTTADSIMQLNAKDKGNRKWILIQYPEECAETTNAYKEGYKTISQVAMERVRRAAKKIHQDNPDSKFDDGFRVLKLDDTNMKDVYYAAGDYTQDLVSMLESNVKPDRTDLDLLFGCLLDWGLPLSLPYTSETIDGCTVHTYNDGDLIACFDENVPESVIKTIAKRQPLRAVFRDTSFANSPAKINVGEIFKLLAPDTRVKVI